MTTGMGDMSAAAAPEIGRPVIIGLVGAGIQLSRTPLMHEVEGARLGLRLVYKLLDTDTASLAGRPIADILWAAEACGFSGLNVTYPFKQAVLPHLDELSDNAERLGAVNTVVLRNGKRYGHNTDLIGFAEGFRRTMQDVSLERVFQVGAGGAGSAVSRALMQLGTGELSIYDIDGSKAQALADQLARDFGAGRVRAVTMAEAEELAVHGLVNTTPVGMAKSPGLPVPEALLKPGTWVGDIIYFPLETELLAKARARGLRTLSGAPMAVYQAVRAFELFTGIAPDPAAMERTFSSFNQQPTGGNGQKSPGAAAQPMPAN